MKESWAETTRQIFWAEQEYWENIPPEAPTILKVPNFYKDEEGYYKAQAVLEEQTSAALYWAVNYKLLTNINVDPSRAEWSASRANEHLLHWALNMREAKGKESKFVLVYEGHKFLDAMDYLEGYGVYGEFPPWLATIYLPIARKIAFTNKNNHGAWGWCAFLRAKRHLNQPISPYLDSLISHIKNAISPDGSMPYEIRRTNSGMWYVYFALAPYARVMFDFLKYEEVDLFYMLEPALDWYFEYCKNPDSWPYRLPKSGFLRWLYKIFWPCSDEMLVPRPYDWPANLLEQLATRVFNRPDWLSWIEPPVMAGGLNIFKYSTLVWANNLEN
jgi:hypothetical protein